MKKILATLAAAVLLAAVTAQAADFNFRGTVPSSGSIASGVTIAASGTTNLTTTFPVGPYGVALYPTFKSGTNETTTSNLTFTVYASANGSTWTTLGVYTNTLALSGTNVLTRYWLIPPTAVANVTAAKVSVSNADSGSAVTLSSLSWVSH